MTTAVLTPRRQFEKRIGAGIILFHHYYPGWVYEVHLADLDMRDPENCVLGQVALAHNMSYSIALLRIILDGYADHFCDAQIRYGFVPSVGVDWCEATNMWRDTILSLRHPASLLAA